MAWIDPKKKHHNELFLAGPHPSHHLHFPRPLSEALPSARDQYARFWHFLHVQVVLDCGLCDCICWNQITIIIINFPIFAAPSSSSSLPSSISSSQKPRTSGLRLKFENDEKQTGVELFVFQMIQKFFSPSVTQWHTNMRDVITWEIFLKLVLWRMWSWLTATHV